MTKVTSEEGLRELIRRLESISTETPPSSVITGFIKENPSLGDLSELLKSNLDLLHGSVGTAEQVRDIILQLALELPAAAPLLSAAERIANAMSSHRIFRHEPNSLYFNEKGVSILRKHTSRITGLIGLGEDRMVSGDKAGKLLIWRSLIPLEYTILEGHDQPIKGCMKIDSGSFLSWDTRTANIWNFHSGQLELSIPFRHDLSQVISLNDGLIVFKSIVDSYTVIDELEIERSREKTILLSAFNHRESKTIWERETDVDDYSALLPLTDGRLLVSTSISRFEMSSGWAKQIIVLDPISGKSDETIEELSNSAKYILLSTDEMPVFRREFRNEVYYVDCQEETLSIPPDNPDELTDYTPYLFKGPGVVFHDSARDKTYVYHPSTKSYTRKFTGVLDPLIHMGRYMLLYQQTGESEMPICFTSKRIVFDLVSDEVLFSKLKTDPNHARDSHSINEDTIALLSSDDSFEILDLKERRFHSFPGLSSASSLDLPFILKLNGNKYALIDTKGDIQILDRDLFGSNSLKTHSANLEISVLGSEGKYLIAQNGMDNIIIYDTDECDVQCKLEDLTDSVKGMFWLPEGILGAWSNDDALRVWDIESSDVIFRFDFNGWRFHGASVLDDGSLLCWGGQRDGSRWKRAKVVKVNMKSGEQSELLSLDHRIDCVSGNKTMLERMIVIGGCMQLKSGRILIYPYWGLPYGDSIPFEILSIDPDNPSDVYSIPTDGYLPCKLCHLPGDLLAISTSSFFPNKKQHCRMLFRDAATGKSFYDSDILEDDIFDIFTVDDGLIGGLTREGMVYLFNVKGKIQYQGEVKLEDLVRNHAGLARRTRPLKDLGSGTALLGIAPVSFSLHNLWDSYWSRFWGSTEVRVEGSDVVVTDSRGSRRCVGRAPLKQAYAFENSIVILSRDGRVGFLKSY